jgi:alkanesulfonate monooxygenase SsuD/methylene tetrahydromethanopterin reductase-like flavin-dependent oxidoreductase (luciferase family)
VEFDGFGLRRRDRGRSMDRLLPTLVELVGEEGSPPVPVSVAAASTVAAERAGRFGLPVFADSTMTAAELTDMLAGYRASASAAGVPAARNHYLQRDVFVTEDPERDWGILFPELRYMRRQYGAWSFPPEPDEELKAYLGRLESDIEVKLKNLIFGRPEEVAERLRSFQRLGFDHIVCRSQYGNLPRETFRRAVEQLGRVRRLVAQ